MLAAGGQQRRLLSGRQLVRRRIAATLEEGERAVVRDEVFGEEGVAVPALREKPPQSSPAHFRARAG